jgi:tRNA U34 5-methylaminomethyl-2-thiouridine-forming methyltransferase MnmC
MTAELVGGPWCGKLAEIPPKVDEWHLPAPAFARNPELASDQDATLLYRRRGDSGKFDYVQTAAA